MHQKEARLIEIDSPDDIYSVAFLVDGKHVVGGGKGGKIQRWRVEDGKEVGTPMGAGGIIFNIAVSQDGKWVVSGTNSTRGLVTVWDVESHSRLTGFNGHRNWVRAVDISPDATKIATGSRDKTVCVWSLSTGQRLLEPLEHDHWVVAVKFSPDGRRIATATWGRDAVRVYDVDTDSQSGPLVEFPVQVNSFLNQSLVWASDSKQLFALSRDGSIHCLDVSTLSMRSQWHINSSRDARCIALASNGTFVAASALSSVSLWDTTTHKKIECVIHHTVDIMSMAISSNYDLVTAGGNEITVRNLRDVLPSRYCDDVSAFASCVHCVKWLPNHRLLFWLRQRFREREIARMGVEKLRPEEINNSKIAHLETVQELRHELVTSQRVANQKEDRLNETIRSLRADLHTQQTSTSAFIWHHSLRFPNCTSIEIANVEKTVQELRNQLATFQCAANQEKDILNETINSLRAEQQHSCEFIAT
jgi:WD40 repeat protein